MKNRYLKKKKTDVREHGHTMKFGAHLNKRQPVPGREKRHLE